MTMIKICGLTRPDEIGWINEARPDFCGFVINVKKSRRSIDVRSLRTLRSLLDESVIPVGVFVDEPAETIIGLASDHTLGAVQLHGGENNDYIRTIMREVSIPVIKAYKIDSPASVFQAVICPADFILLDNGGGGSGRAFDWSLIRDIRRPFILAGGLGPDNLRKAICRVRPWGVDMSSGVETDGHKDKGKILAAVAAVRREKT